jgi:hypothetical protein
VTIGATRTAFGLAATTDSVAPIQKTRTTWTTPVPARGATAALVRNHTAFFLRALPPFFLPSVLPSFLLPSLTYLLSFILFFLSSPNAPASFAVLLSGTISETNWDYIAGIQVVFFDGQTKTIGKLVGSQVSSFEFQPGEKVDGQILLKESYLAGTNYGGATNEKGQLGYMKFATSNGRTFEVGDPSNPESKLQGRAAEYLLSGFHGKETDDGGLLSLGFIAMKPLDRGDLLAVTYDPASHTPGAEKNTELRLAANRPSGTVEVAVITACNPTGKDRPIVEVDKSYSRKSGRKYEFSMDADFPFDPPTRVTAFLPVAVTKDGINRWDAAFEEEMSRSEDDLTVLDVTETRSLSTDKSTASVETLVQWAEETKIFHWQGTYAYQTIDKDVIIFRPKDPTKEPTWARSSQLLK